MALDMDLSYLPLAEQVIDSLERWSKSSSLTLTSYYEQLLPYFDDFLRLSHHQ
ncbi:unnamed protein product, partial [Didymodactylos carnosus]